MTDERYTVKTGGRVGQRFIRIAGPGMSDTGAYVFEQWPEKDKAIMLQNLLDRAFQEGKQAGVGLAGRLEAPTQSTT